MTSPSERRAHVVGLGLIGASVARALASVGWSVTGSDRAPDVVERAKELSIIRDAQLAPGTTLVVIATPAGTVADLAAQVLDELDDPEAIVTDVAGVKSAIVATVNDARFIGGHPMAGSEQRGLAASRDDLFRGCTWVLTPTAATEPGHYSRLHGYLRELGANVVEITAADHDRLVALASHVPHLLAGALMNEASLAAEQDAVLLQLAAGGFRDMTRIAAGDPSIWPDVLFENRDAITQTLTSLEERLANIRVALREGQREEVATKLAMASVARRQLPGRALSADRLAYLRVAVSDRPGELATVTVAASDMGVNIFDIEIAHGIEGVSGTLLLAVDAEHASRFTDALVAMGFSVTLER